MKITKERGFKAVLVLGAVLWLSLIAASWADAAETSEPEADRSPAAAQAAASEGDEYNFNWLDPEKKIYVLQNRRYLKAGRPMLSLMGGLGFSNPYRSSLNADARAAYYLSEAWGLEAFYAYTRNTTNSTFEALQGTGTNARPVIREITGQYGLLAHWVPWYAKINVFNKILYFDWYFSGGAGGVSYTMFNSSADGVAANVVTSGVVRNDFAFFLGTGHVYHLTERFTARLDFTSSIYKAELFGTGGGATWYSNLNFGAGFGIRL